MKGVSSELLENYDPILTNHLEEEEEYLQYILHFISIFLQLVNSIT